LVTAGNEDVRTAGLQFSAWESTRAGTKFRAGGVAVATVAAAASAGAAVVGGALDVVSSRSEKLREGLHSAHQVGGQPQSDYEADEVEELSCC
jgi:hypothetical protein